MNKESKPVVVIGIIVLSIILYSWNMQLKRMELWSSELEVAGIDSLIQVRIDQKYGLRAILIILGTGGLSYILNKRNSKNKTPQ